MCLLNVSLSWMDLCSGKERSLATQNSFSRCLFTIPTYVCSGLDYLDYGSVQRNGFVGGHVGLGILNQAGRISSSSISKYHLVLAIEPPGTHLHRGYFLSR